MKQQIADAISIACGDDPEAVNGLLLVLARQRVENDPELLPHSELIFGDWPNMDEHIPWLLISTTARIADWIACTQSDADS